MRRTVAATMPIRMAFLRCPSGSPAAASPITIALSPARTRSIITTWNNAVRDSEEINSSMGPLRVKVQSDIAVRWNCQRGPGLDAQIKRRSRTAENAFLLLRLIQEGEKPDHLVRLDQNGDDDADECQASGEVEPHDAESASLTKPCCAGRRRANHEHQRSDRRRQCVRRHQVPDGEGG